MKILFALILMTRPAQLVAVTLVYAFGAVIAAGGGHPLPWEALLWGWAALMPVSASIHLANEYADYETDRLADRTPFSGGSGAFVRFGAPRDLALRGAWTTLLVGALVAAAAAARGLLGAPALAVLGAGAFFGWMYSLQPLALAWKGWGELDNAALGGILLPVYSYTLITRHVELQALLAVLPFGMLVFINLLATTWPDRKADAAVGKFTLATRLPPHSLRLMYWAVAAGGFILLPLLADWVLPPVVVWTCLLTVPVVLWGAVAYTRRHSPLPTVAAMIVMLITHGLAWFASIG